MRLVPDNTELEIEAIFSNVFGFVEDGQLVSDLTLSRLSGLAQ